jgi:hypothetical protein
MQWIELVFSGTRDCRIWWQCPTGRPSHPPQPHAWAWFGIYPSPLTPAFLSPSSIQQPPRPPPPPPLHGAPRLPLPPALAALAASSPSSGGGPMGGPPRGPPMPPPRGGMDPFFARGYAKAKAKHTRPKDHPRPNTSETTSLLCLSRPALPFDPPSPFCVPFPSSPDGPPLRPPFPPMMNGPMNGPPRGMMMMRGPPMPHMYGPPRHGRGPPPFGTSPGHPPSPDPYDSTPLSPHLSSFTPLPPPSPSAPHPQPCPLMPAASRSLAIQSRDGPWWWAHVPALPPHGRHDASGRAALQQWAPSQRPPPTGTQGRLRPGYEERGRESHGTRGRAQLCKIPVGWEGGMVPSTGRGLSPYASLVIKEKPAGHA